MNCGNSRTMFGVSPDQGISVLIRYPDWLFLDAVLSSKPKWNNIVETGTYYGLTSLYLGVVAELRGGQVHTFDRIDQRLQNILNAWPDCVHFCHEDILGQFCSELSRWASRPNTFVFFDNGDKVKEVHIYAKRLDVGSGFVIHDCGLEWKEEDLMYPVTEWGCSEYMKDVALELGTSCRCYVRTK